MAWAFCCSSAQPMFLLVWWVRPYVVLCVQTGFRVWSDLSQLRATVLYACVHYAGYFFFYGIGINGVCGKCAHYKVLYSVRSDPQCRDTPHRAIYTYIENLILVWIWIWTPPTCKLPCPTHTKYFSLYVVQYIYAVNMNSGASKPLNAQPLRLKPAPIAEAPTVGSARALRPLPFPGLAWRATVCIERGTLRGLRA